MALAKHPADCPPFDRIEHAESMFDFYRVAHDAAVLDFRRVHLYRRVDVKSIGVVAAIFVTAACLSIGVFVTRPVSIKPDCYTDGHYYSAVTQGHAVAEPFNRRPFVPVVARLLPGSLPSRYHAIAFTSLVVAAFVSAALPRRIAYRLTVRDQRERVAVMIAAAATVIVLPHGLRFALSVPVLVDMPALAAGLTWIFLFTSRNVYVEAASVPAAIVAVATRELWAMVVVAACVIALVRGRRLVAIANATAAVLTYRWVHNIAPVGSVLVYPSDALTLKYWFERRFRDNTELAQMVWGTVFAVGLMPLVFLFRWPFRWLHAELVQQRDLTAVTLLASGILLVGSAPFLGSDQTRLAYPGGVLLVTVAFPWIAANPQLGTQSVLLALATLFLWAPTHALIATGDEYRSFYRPWTRTESGLAVSLAAVITCVLLQVALQSRTGRTKPDLK